ncbi:MAG TPA: hypothetical protein VE177_02460 [Candidatus Binatus sp.]|nr:hypothetical protein [Candidatus Binatus sp.]
MSAGTPGAAYYQSGRSQTGLLEKIELFLPGFRGYKEKELRRESDKLIRNQIYLKLADSLSKTKDVYRSLVNQHVTETWDDTDRLSARLERVSQQVNHSEYGYAGFFDIVKVKEPQLDQMMDYDYKLLQMSDGLAQAVDALKDTVDSEKWADARGKVLDAIKQVDSLETAYNGRKQVILGAQ